MSTNALLGTGEMTVRGLLQAGRHLLKESGVENAEREAAWLMEFGLNTSRLEIHIDGGREVGPDDRLRVMDLFARRAGREPLQYILGTQEFCGLEFSVSPAVLIPRPETEVLVREVVRHAGRLSHPVIADVGTGSGCIAIALAKAVPTASLYALDCSRSALRLARDNATRHAVADRVQCLEGDLLEPLRHLGLEGRLAVVVSNPPYVPDGEVAGLQPEVAIHEPRSALAGGPDGLAIHRRILREAAAWLAPRGVLALEVGQGQAQSVRRAASGLGKYEAVRIIKDHAGIDRVVCMTRRAEGA